LNVSSSHFFLNSCSNCTILQLFGQSKSYNTINQIYQLTFHPIKAAPRNFSDLLEGRPKLTLSEAERGISEGNPSTNHVKKFLVRLYLGVFSLPAVAPALNCVAVGGCRRVWLLSLGEAKKVTPSMGKQEGSFFKSIAFD